MEQLIRIGIDTSKSVFQLHGVDAHEQPVLRKKLQRRQVLEFFRKLAPAKIGMEACGSAHYWARELKALGHDVVLLPPHYVKAYVKRGKSDAADAQAICEAMSRPSMRFVPAKSAERQAAQIRGHAAEFGLIAAKGLAKIEPLLARIQTDGALPKLAKGVFSILAEEHVRCEKALEALDAKLMALHRDNEMSRRLREIPSIGPINATALAIKVTDPKAFRSGRDFAAWLGLTPKNHSTAGKTRLGVITRAGDEMLRSTLIVGATALIQQVRRGRTKPSAWLAELLKRKTPKHAAVALANKTARIAWKLMVSGERYRPQHAAKLAAGA